MTKGRGVARYVQWCERRTPSLIGGGAVYSIVSCRASHRPSIKHPPYFFVTKCIKLLTWHLPFDYKISPLESLLLLKRELYHVKDPLLSRQLTFLQ